MHSKIRAMVEPRNVYRHVAPLVVASVLMAQCGEPRNDEQIFMEPEEAESYPGYELQGEYSGNISENEFGSEPGMQLAVYGEHEFKMIVYEGGLPGEPITAETEYYTAEGRYENGVLSPEDDAPFMFRYRDGEMEVLDNDNNTLGRLDRTKRQSPTLGAAPPPNARVLFDGTGLDQWQDDAEMTEENLLTEGATTADDYGDIQLHVEAMLSFMPEHTGQSRANSGIYIQNRYEVQVLDSFGLPASVNGNGSLYNESAPIVNASLPPLRWQTYDIYFRAPRFDEDGNKTENARVTAYLNGVLVQDDVELEQGTGAGGDREEVAKAELYLQQHTGPMRFRNVWLVETEYDPPEQKMLSFDE